VFVVRAKITFSVWLIFLLIIVLVGASSTKPVFAGESQSRQKTIRVEYVEHEWWLVKSSDNQIACKFYIRDHNWPSRNEVFSQCGDDLYQEWVTTSDCSSGAINQAGICGSLYLHQSASRPKTQDIVVGLPPINLTISLPACEHQSATLLCPRRPVLLLAAEEPLPNNHITFVHYSYWGQEFTCLGTQCELPIPPTGDAGTQISFWATSSFGDESEHFTAKVRAVETSQTDDDLWQVSVISSQWKGKAPACCSQTWSTFPSVDGLSSWLLTNDELQSLSTNEPYTYLAGRLISQGIVDASECSWNGLLSNGAANPCGMEIARGAVDVWQNRFDNQILQVANLTGVPAQLMKNIIAQESQFWPGVYLERREYGLGQITDQGADTVLLWNPTFYDEFCPLVLAKETCKIGYSLLDLSHKELLRGSLAVEANSQCSDCVYGLDLSHAEFSINLLAKSIKANCEQVGQIIRNETFLEPSAVSSYEDLWRFTLANYNAGPGCLIDAIRLAYLPGYPLTWSEVARSLISDNCSGAVQYVENITRE